MDTNNKKRTINILDLRDSPWVDGPGRTILDCARSLQDTEYNIIIGAFSGGKQKTNAYAEEAISRGLTVLNIEERSAFDMRVVKRIFDIVDEHNIDIIHTHDFRSNLFGIVCGKIKRRPVITTVHGWIANDMKGKIYTIIDKLLLRLFDRIITVSERTSGLVRKAWVPNRKVHVISNALIGGMFVPDKADTRFRNEIGVSADTKLIANIGRLSPEKGQYEFLQSACEIVKSNKNVKFILIGIGPDKEMLDAYVKENKLEGFVIFCGYRDDMTVIFNSLDLIVQSSYTEGMPNVILEAQFMKVPVIATDVGGTAEIIKHLRTGILLEPGSVFELTKEIKKYLEKSDEYIRMADDGRELVEDKFEHGNRVKKLIKVYESTLRQKCV